MTDLPLPSFPAHAACRSFCLRHIDFKITKAKVASLLVRVDVGISHDDFKLYWDTRPPYHVTHLHRGYCCVEFRTRELAVLAWSRLNGLHKWCKGLVVRPVAEPGALEPSHDELNAARRQRLASSANHPFQPARWHPKDNPHKNPTHMAHRITKNYASPSNSCIQKRSRVSGHKASAGGRTPHAAEGSSTNADNTSHQPDHKPPTQAGSDIWSDGSLREKIQRNANEVGPGWGGYGPFQANPSRGPIDPAEVQALNWHDPTPFRYIDVDGDIVLHVSAALANKKEERTESLWFVLAQASGEMTDDELREKEKTLPSPRDAGL